MANPALQTEDIAWSLRQVLTDKMPIYLATVEARRNAENRHIVSLPPLVSVDFGFEVEIMEAPVTEFPRIAFIAAPRSPSTDTSDQGMFASATHDVILDWLVLGNTPLEATVRGWRYGEAILECLMRNGPFAGFEAMTMVPPTGEMQPLEYDGDSARNLGRKMYFGGGEITIPMRGEYYL